MESDYLIEKKVETLIEMKTGKLLRQLEEAKTAMNAMQQEITILQNKVARISIAPQATLASLSDDAPKATTPKTAPTNARTGDAQPGQFSVEKMFYFGNK